MAASGMATWWIYKHRKAPNVARFQIQTVTSGLKRFAGIRYETVKNNEY
jgi:hypothetical protein